VDISNTSILKKRSIFLMVIPKILIPFQPLSQKCSFFKIFTAIIGLRTITGSWHFNPMRTIYLDNPRQNYFTGDNCVIKQKKRKLLF
jgi:hypothetical protein